MLKSPVIYFPTTSVFVEDDPMFVNLLNKRMDIYPPLIPLNSPDRLLQQKERDLLFFHEEDREIGTDNFLKNITQISAKHNLISVIVSDLHMREKSGTDLFYEVLSPYVGRILVSFYLDYHNNPEIIQSLTDNAIHIALDKSKELHTVLPEAIAKEKIKFFTRLSNTLFGKILNKHPLTDTKFSHFFNSLILKYKPLEIHANNNFSVFTFLFDKNQNKKLKITVTDIKEIKSQLECHHAQLASASVITSLEKGERILCQNDEDILLNGDKWTLNLLPAQKFEGNQSTYFFNLTEEINEINSEHCL